MSKVQSNNKTNDDVITVSEGTRQTACVGATQSACRTADIAHYRAALASATLNNCGTTQFIRALQELGTGGA